MGSDLQTLPTLEKTPVLPSINQPKADPGQYKEPGYFNDIRKYTQGAGLVGTLADFVVSLLGAQQSQAKRRRVESTSFPTVGSTQQGLPFLGRK